MTLMSSYEQLMSNEHVTPPNPIVIGQLGLDVTDTVVDRNGFPHDIITLTPDNEMPREVAEWLHYRTFTENVVAAEHEADRYRFKDIDEIVESFLFDQTGRTLFLAVGQSNGFVYGASWLHKLENNVSDHLLVAPAIEYLERHDFLQVPVDKISTFATREYDGAVRSGLALQLGILGVERYFREHDKECLLVVGRYGGNDNFQVEIVDAEDTDLGHKFTPIESRRGYIILGSMNPLQQTETES